MPPFVYNLYTLALKLWNMLLQLDLNHFYSTGVFVCVSSKWRVATGTDYVPVILFITVGAHGVSVADSLVYMHLLQHGDPSPCV